jgi:hypothetical protein
MECDSSMALKALGNRCEATAVCLPSSFVWCMRRVNIDVSLPVSYKIPQVLMQSFSSVQYVFFVT